MLLALLGVLALPAAVLAADPVDVAGGVTNADATPAAGVEVLVIVEGSDIVTATTTDDAGAFALQVEAEVGDTLEVRATGPTIRTGPDEDGCVTSSTSSGTVTITIEVLPLAPVAVVLDRAISSVICSTTAGPDQATRHPRSEPTPPATDGPGSGAVGGTGWLAVLAGLACISAAALVATGRRRRVTRRG
jgi:hypothetical protein